MLRFFCVVSLLSVVLSAVSADELKTCPNDRVAIANPPPNYPSPKEALAYFGHSTSYMHVFVEGSVVVSFIVSASGNVGAITVLESTYSLVGPHRDQYEDGYFDKFHPTNVMRAVRSWKFSPMDYSCQITRKFSWIMED